MVELLPSDATRWQRRNRRYLGVSFAVSHFIHPGVILALAALDRELFWKLTNITTIVLAGAAYLFIAAMTATSFDRTAAWLGPPKSQFPAFCVAAVVFLQRHRSKASRAYLDIPVDEMTDSTLARYVSKVTIRESKAWLNWYWPAHSGGGVGTSDGELMAVFNKKVVGYRPPIGLIASHLVVYGGGPGLSRIAAPFSAEQLENFPMVNEALCAGPFDEVAILDLRDFLWVKGAGWAKLPDET